MVLCTRTIKQTLSSSCSLDYCTCAVQVLCVSWYGLYIYIYIFQSDGYIYLPIRWESAMCYFTQLNLNSSLHYNVEVMLLLSPAPLLQFMHVPMHVQEALLHARSHDGTRMYCTQAQCWRPLPAQLCMQLPVTDQPFQSLLSQMSSKSPHYCTCRYRQTETGKRLQAVLHVQSHVHTTVRAFVLHSHISQYVMNGMRMRFADMLIHLFYVPLTR